MSSGPMGQSADARRSCRRPRRAAGSFAARPKLSRRVRGGLLSLDDACKRYTLTVEELPGSTPSTVSAWLACGRHACSSIATKEIAVPVESQGEFVNSRLSEIART